MKIKLVAVVALLALPATAFGVTSIWLEHDGQPFFTGQVPGGLLSLDVMVSFDYGDIYTVSGGLYLDSMASSVTISEVTYAGLVFPPWSYPYATPVGSNLSQHIDFGTLNFGSVGELLALAGPHKYATIVLNVAALTPGVYHITIGDSASGQLSGKGYWASIIAPTDHTGEATAFDDDGGFTLTISAPCEALTILSSKSVKTHGTSTYGIEGSSTETGQKSIECRHRSASPVQATISKVVTVFNQAITRINNNSTDVSVNSGTIGTISVTTTTVTGDTLVVPMSDVPDNAVFRIGFPGIKATCDDSTTTDTKCWKVIRGDYNASGTVTVQADVVLVRNLVGQPLNFSATAFRADYDCSGSITVQTDVVGVRNRVGGACTGCTCP